jgi:hypothetical protein
VIKSIGALVAGFCAAALILIGPPAVFAMIPGAAMFLLLAPLWGVVALPVIVVLTALLFFFGKKRLATGAALLLVVVALSALPKMIVGTVQFAMGSLETSSRFTRMIEDECGKGYVDVAPQRAGRVTRLIFDDIGNMPYMGHDPADMAAVLAGVEVVGLSRRASEFIEAWSTRADRGPSCEGGRSSRTVETTMRGNGPFPDPLKIDMCVRRTKIADPTQDGAHAIVFRRGPSRGGFCYPIDVVERVAGEETLLGRVHFHSATGSLYPTMPRAADNPRGDWFLAILRAVLSTDVSEDALRKHVASR